MNTLSGLRARYAPTLAKIAEGALEREQERQLPHAAIDLLKASGLTAARVPVADGGDGASLPELFGLLIDLAAADPNVAQALRAHFAFVEDRLYAPDSADRSRWLAAFARGEIVGNAVTETGNVTLGDTLTRVTPAEPDGWTVTGRKYYTTGSIFAEWIDTTARTPDGIEVAALVRNQAPQVTVSDDWTGFGQRLTGSGTAIFTAAPVIDAHVYPFDGRFPYQTAFYQLVLNAVEAGIARAIERDLVHELRERSRVYSHGNASRASDDPQLLAIVGEASAAAFAAEASVEKAATVLQRAFELRGSPESGAIAAAKRDAELASAASQLISGRAAVQSASELFDALGASATSASRALDRHWRNARTVRSHNPVPFKARILGGALVNGTEPPYEWSIGIGTQPK